MTTTTPSKLMLTMTGAPGPALVDPTLHERLAATGVRRIQVNLDDADVAGAMRLGSGGVPVTAVVSLWTGDPAAGVTLVGTAGEVVGAWTVEERRPIEPPAYASGERADALANVAILRRPQELEREVWLHRWLVDHTGVAIATQATFGYVQNIVVESLVGDAPRVDALVEELFPSAGITDVHAFYGSGGDDAELGRRLTALMASVAAFGADRELDLVPTSRWVFDL